jgi:hypothetical protein
LLALIAEKSLMQDKPKLKIDWASHEAAKYACENWHYSGCLPVGKLVKVGAWENGKFIGVVLFGRGASPNLGTAYNLKQDEVCELLRIAMTSHESFISKIMSLSIKFLKKTNPNLKLIVSFADPNQGHHGGIYQATNWIYSGKSNKTTELYIDGRWQHRRNGFHKITSNTKKRIVDGKHRYLMPLNSQIQEKILQLSKPYPKRAKEQDSEFPFELGGSTPTRTLHN